MSSDGRRDAPVCSREPLPSSSRSRRFPRVLLATSSPAQQQQRITSSPQPLHVGEETNLIAYVRRKNHRRRQTGTKNGWIDRTARISSLPLGCVQLRCHQPSSNRGERARKRTPAIRKQARDTCKSQKGLLRTRRSWRWKPARATLLGAPQVVLSPPPCSVVSTPDPAGESETVQYCTNGSHPMFESRIWYLVKC